MFKKNKNTTETAKKISSVYDQGVSTYHQVQNWFSVFLSGNTSLKDEHEPGSSPDLDQDDLRELVEWNPYKSSWGLTLDLNTSSSSI